MPERQAPVAEGDALPDASPSVGTGTRAWWLSPAGGLRQDLLLSGIIVVLLIVFTFTGPGFLTLFNINSMAQEATETAMLAVAETFVITMAGIDLSVGATLGLSGVLGALVMQHATGPLGGAGGFFVGALAGVAVGALVGLANGLMIVYVRITAFIATLATLGIATGLTLVITNGIDIQGVPTIAVSWGNNIFGGVFTIPIVVAIFVAVAGGICLHQSRFGRWTFAIGSSAQAARGAGISVSRHTIAVYCLSGILAGLAGVVVLMRIGTGSPTEGTNDELNAIAAVVIGGASLFGGIGTMLGSMLGAILLSIVLSGLVISGVEPYWQTVVTGMLIALAVGFQELNRRQGQAS